MKIHNSKKHISTNVTRPGSIEEPFSFLVKMLPDNTKADTGFIEGLKCLIR